MAEFQQLCEVQSDKASVEITSQYEGTITRLLHSEGDIVQVWLSFCTLSPQGSHQNAPHRIPKFGRSACIGCREASSCIMIAGGGSPT